MKVTYVKKCLVKMSSLLLLQKPLKMFINEIYIVSQEADLKLIKLLDKTFEPINLSKTGFQNIRRRRRRKSSL